MLVKQFKNSSIRSAKTDAQDTNALAKLFYDIDFDFDYNPSKDEKYYELK